MSGSDILRITPAGAADMRDLARALEQLRASHGNHGFVVSDAGRLVGVVTVAVGTPSTAAAGRGAGRCQP